MEAVTTAPPDELPGPVMTADRAAYLSRALVALATVMIDSMLADLAAGSTASTGGDSPLSERMLYRLLSPQLPKLRAVFLDKLSTSEPAGLERLMGATSSTIETILAQAPGDPMPRWTFEWLPGEARPRLVPVDPRP